MLRVVAGIIYRQNRVLLARRPFTDLRHASLPGLWEFPGGKLHVGEQEFAGLARELNEELGIQVQEAVYFDTSFYEYGHKRVLISAYIVTVYKGEIRLQSHDAVMWRPIDDIDHRAVAPADVPFIQKLKRYSSSSSASWD